MLFTMNHDHKQKTYTYESNKSIQKMQKNIKKAFAVSQGKGKVALPKSTTSIENTKVSFRTKKKENIFRSNHKFSYKFLHLSPYSI